MLQSEMFGPRLGEHLGNGLYSHAYLLSNGLVCKVGLNDGTRNWLEFCRLERLGRRLLPLMPEVFDVMPLDEGRYMATMPLYENALDLDEGRYMATMPLYENARGLMEHKYAGYAVRNHPGYAEVVERFMAYMAPMDIQDVYDASASGLFNDMHSGNTMVCPKRGIVLTDPSATEYRWMVERPELTLH